MKRASLTVPPAKPKTEAPDLTDRLLSRGETPAPKRTARKGGSETRPDASRPIAKPAPAAPRASKPPPSPSTPSSAPSVTREAVDTSAAASVDKALAHCNEALAALKAAANDVPARYDVAIRFRLDALAHHIRQVAEYLASAARK